MAEAGARPGRIARVPAVEPRGEGPAVQVHPPSGWREPLRQLAEIGRRGAGAAAARVIGGALQAGGERRVRAGGGQCEVAPALLVVVDERGEPPVQLAPGEGVEPAVGARRQQRVREAQPLAVELDHPGGERGAQRRLASRQRKARAGQRGGRGERLQGRLGQRLQAGEHEVP
jgi:hypothetical protein